MTQIKGTNLIKENVKISWFAIIMMLLFLFCVFLYIPCDKSMVIPLMDPLSISSVHVSVLCSPLKI